jgi:hypothetical protein
MADGTAEMGCHATGVHPPVRLDDKIGLELPGAAMRPCRATRGGAASLVLPRQTSWHGKPGY